MPILFSQMTAGLLLAIFFFALLVFAALTSAISLLEVLVGTLIDLVGWGRRKATYAAAAVVFLFGIPSALSGSEGLFANWSKLFGKNFFDTMDYLASNWMLPMGGLAIAIFVGWFVKPELLRNEILEGTPDNQRRLWTGVFRVWLVVLRFLVPIMVGLVLLNKIGILPTEFVNKLF